MTLTFTLFALLYCTSIQVFSYDVDNFSSKLKDIWKQEITHNWENLNHAIAFKHWQKAFNKTYTDLREEAHRFLIFLDNWKMINDHNVARHTNHTMRLNQFGDLTPDEFQYYVHGHLGSCLTQTNVTEDITIDTELPSSTDVPTFIDWTDYNGGNYVSSVKNQGHCGSCWAFSATGAIESRTAILTGTTGSDIIDLAAQELVDCSESTGNSGCNGGLMTDAFKYIRSSGGLCIETDYPYKAKQGTCRSDVCGTKYDPIVAYYNVKRDSEESLMAALATGPVSLAVEADQSVFQFYSGGILDGLCGSKLDHGVLAVGYGTKSGMDYWKVKNSWGSGWGEDGYLLICRNCNKNGKKGECGIRQTPSYPLPQP